MTILYTLIGGLFLAAIVSWIKANRLAILLPKLFTYSHLPQVGQLVELTIFNRGFKTEESVALYLNPSLTYQLIGATIENVTINKGTLEISRVGIGDDVTIILSVGNGTFAKIDILRCISKETTGKVYSSLETIPPTGIQRLGLAFVFIVIPALMVLAFFGVVKPIIEGYALPTAETKSGDGAGDVQARVSDWTLVYAMPREGGVLYKEFVAGRLAPKIGPISFKGERVSIPLTFSNPTDGPLDFSASMNTEASIDEIPSYERSLSEIIVFPGKSVTRTIEVIIPTDASDLERAVFMDSRVTQLNDDESLKVKRTFLIEAVSE